MAKESFEEALAKLEQITRELETGDLKLEDALKKFDQGIKLADFCNQRLAEAQQKVDVLMKKENTLTAVPLDSCPPETK